MIIEICMGLRLVGGFTYLILYLQMSCTSSILEYDSIALYLTEL